VSVERTLRTAVVAAAMAVCATGHADAQAEGVYRALTVQAAPGELLELVDLYREEQALLAGLGEEPPMWMRHSQGDIWDLLLLYPVADLSGFFDTARTRRRLQAMTPGGRSGAELQREIDARTAWREEVFVRGPAVAEVREAWADAGYFHVEMFEGLAGRRADLVHEREMENDYLVRLGRKPNHIFTRIAGSSTDAFTVGYYRDLKAYANPPETTPEEEEAAAVAAGFRGAAFIGAYLRELILRHHDTLAVPIR
jgi:hypothetical protein